MITNTGKSIISKYLLGQAPAYASYIAVGCGAQPILGYPSGSALEDLKEELSEKTTLDFEMFRVPITSRGFVNEDGVSKLVLTAELPTEERYEISEVGVYSAGSNPAAASFDSRIILGFTQNEAWQSHTRVNDTGSDDSKIISLPFIAEALDQDNSSDELEPKTSSIITGATTNGSSLLTFTSNNSFILGEEVVVSEINPSDFNKTGIIVSATPTQFIVDISPSTVSSSITYTSGGSAESSAPFFQVNSDNAAFSKSGRVDKYERGRYYNNMIVVRTDMSDLFKQSDGSLSTDDNLYHIHLNGIRTDLNRNSPLDELRLAFSILCRDKDVVPETINILLEFRDTDQLSGSGNFAKMEISLTQGVDGVNFNDNRYFVINKKIQDLVTSSGFTWNAVNVVKAYASATKEFRIKQKSRTDNVVTITTEGNHGVSTGDFVNIYDIDSPEISGIYEITYVDDDTFIYTVPGNEDGSLDIALTTITPQDSNHKIDTLIKDFYVAFDGLRLENLTTQNPLYGLTGYSLIKSGVEYAYPIVKNPNSNNYIEFRFALEVT